MIQQLLTALRPDRFTPWDAVDILVLAFVFYQILLLIRGTRAVQMTVGIAFLVVAFFFTGPDGILPLNTFHRVLSYLLFWVPVAIIVLFQSQLRQALASFGRNPFSRLGRAAFQERMVEEIALAATAMATKGIGGLIVIERQHGLRSFAETGIKLESAISYDLLMNIFSPQTPLHDGAVIISEGRIQAASCFLPLTSNPTLTREYGTRHRAGIGITEETDALAIVISEERGTVSLARDGVLRRDLDARSLRALLQECLNIEPQRRPSEEEAGEEVEPAAESTA
jgi:diadenylate cyclase